MDPTLIFYACLLFLWLTYFWETWLSWRQYKVYRNNVQRPPEAEGIIDEESFRKSRLYKIDCSIFSFFECAWEQIQTTIILSTGLIPIFWKISGHLISQSDYTRNSEIIQSVTFLLIAGTLQYIISLPWVIYDTFIIEQRHGFNQQTPIFFIKDQIKKFILMHLVIGLPVTAAIVWIVRAGGEYFFVYVWLFISTLLLFLMTVYPEYIAPLFDKYTPLPEGPLKTSIEALACKLEFPLKKLFVVEGSKRSAHSNAYMYGFWKNKRIVLYDTLIEGYTPIEADKPAEPVKEEKKKKGCSNDEIVAVLGHELGHWKHSHTLLHLVIAEANLFLCLFLFGTLYRLQYLYTAFGFPNEQPVLIGLIVIFQFVFGPYNELLSFLTTVLSRRMEFAADRFSAELGYAKLLSSALVKLGVDNLSFPLHDWLYSAWHHSHPSVLERITVLAKLEKGDKKRD